MEILMEARVNCHSDEYFCEWWPIGASIEG